MSLRHKPIRDITFDDVDTFCLQKIPEGPRLDYKLEISEKPIKGEQQPTALETLIAAFANTLGGGNPVGG